MGSRIRISNNLTGKADAAGPVNGPVLGAHCLREFLIPLPKLPDTEVGSF